MQYKSEVVLNCRVSVNYIRRQPLNRRRTWRRNKSRCTALDNRTLICFRWGTTTQRERHKGCRANAGLDCDIGPCLFKLARYRYLKKLHSSYIYVYRSRGRNHSKFPYYSAWMNAKEGFIFPSFSVVVPLMKFVLPQDSHG